MDDGIFHKCHRGSADAGTEEEETPPNIELGEGVARNHAVVFTDGDKCILFPSCERGATETFVNGRSLQQVLSDLGVEEDAQICRQSEKPEVSGYELQHGDRVIFGRHYFVFVVPSMGSPEIMIASGKVDYVEARNEWQVEQRSAMQRRFSGIHASIFGGSLMGLGAGKSGALQLAERDEVIEAQRAEISELKQQLAAAKAEIRELKHIAGGTLASSTVAHILSGDYRLETSQAGDIKIDRISAAIKKTFTESIDKMMAVEALLSRKQRRATPESGDSAPRPGSILRRAVSEGSRKDMRVRVGLGESEGLAVGN
ncbi:Kif28p [Symbiodinium natans]|uniref:Kif28p protein n=1 Tax=Symbiodinium natans TaxID=878477 RepID=A0A812P1V5_9DINO|nr:Kif28p [Symbiodinium natans]